MEWGDLHVFLNVARAGGIAAAARSLQMDPSTVSRRIARLEQEIGLTLFDRGARRLNLTPEGAQLMDTAGRMESIILRDVQGAVESRRAIAGRVRIGTSEGFGAHYLAPRLPRLMHSHPGLSIDLVALPRNYSLALREVDVAITMDRPGAGDIRFKRLSAYTLGVFASREYLRRYGRPETVDALQDHAWCGYIDDLLFTPELDMLQFGGSAIRPTYRTTSVTAQLQAVLAGTAMAVLPCYMADRFDELERLLPARIELERTYWLCVHGDLADSPRVRTVMAEIDRWVTEDRPVLLPGSAR